MYSPSVLLRKWQRHHKKYLYFTLIEVLVVVAIIAVLAALILPNIFNAKCRSLIRRLLGLLDSIKADINAATSTGPASEQAFRNILQKMRDGVDLFREVKNAACIEKGDKQTINRKIDEIVGTLVQIRSSQEEPVQQMIDELLERLRGERYPKDETE